MYNLRMAHSTSGRGVSTSTKPTARTGANEDANFSSGRDAMTKMGNFTSGRDIVGAMGNFKSGRDKVGAMGNFTSGRNVDIKYNLAGLLMSQSSDNSAAYYCGRRLGVEAIPGSDGQCGPNDGPQCTDCAAAWRNPNQTDILSRR